MSRPLRIVLAGAPHHVMARGNARAAIVQARSHTARPGGIRYQVYSRAGELLYIEDSGSNERSDFLHLGGTLVAERTRPLASETAVTSYLHSDHRGTPSVETAFNGMVPNPGHPLPVGQSLQILDTHSQHFEQGDLGTNPALPFQFLRLGWRATHPGKGFGRQTPSAGAGGLVNKSLADERGYIRENRGHPLQPPKDGVGVHDFGPTNYWFWAPGRLASAKATTTTTTAQVTWRP